MRNCRYAAEEVASRSKVFVHSFPPDAVDVPRYYGISERDTDRTAREEIAGAGTRRSSGRDG